MAESEASAYRPPDDPLWYKDAIFYEVHVRAFCDSNGDGTGDFRGFAQKLDYLEELGVEHDLAAAVLSLAPEGRWVRYFRLHLRSPFLRHFRGFPVGSGPGTPARNAGGH